MYNNDYLLKKIEIECPFCNHVHLVEKRTRQTQALVKGEVVNYEEIYFLCDESKEEENEFIPAGIMDQNLLQVRDAYRKEKNLLTSSEIKEIRDYYELSQRDFSALLGWGDVTITRYESKTIQDETYDDIMRMVFENPMFALKKLDKHKNRFKDQKFKKIRNKIIDKIEKSTSYLKKEEIKSLYVNYIEENEFNGYKEIDIDKVADVIGYFAATVNDLYKVKLMKLLWYADSLYYKRHGKSLTGLVYKHMPYGALPIAFNQIIDLPTVRIEEKLLYNDSVSYKIVPNKNKNINLSNFSLEEVDVLNEIAIKFKDFNSREIVEYMHDEKAYKEIIPFEIIPYSISKELKDLR
ncbi:type II TA system antitoxin MqsA family protein [Haloplasma contractile]|uniref:Prophage ps3 protein 01 n=1 Tax=Haloplasma contractile SSD-17B TaxID=1033810 RepID=U2E7A4_9MOLU|nr:type II TA system antitoxin MqsA family protein [Haloplasma contractile]ERJ11078.1 Prophage ps3 protein 01 [Haloplasma contractile SSD-17B]